MERVRLEAERAEVKAVYDTLDMVAELCQQGSAKVTAARRLPPRPAGGRMPSHSCGVVAALSGRPAEEGLCAIT